MHFETANKKIKGALRGAPFSFSSHFIGTDRPIGENRPISQ